MEIIGSHYKGLKWVMPERNSMEENGVKMVNDLRRLKMNLDSETEFTIYCAFALNIKSDIDFETGNG